MTERRDFLFEIGTEELPPKSLLKLVRAMAASVEAAMVKLGLEFEAVESFATPRRLALIVRSLGVAQADQLVERRGPAVVSAFNPDGTPTKALEGFLKSCGATSDQLLRQSTEKGDWLVYRQTVRGQDTRKLLPDIVLQGLAGLPIAKRMRWGSGVDEFVRPVHWVILLFGTEIVSAKILGVQASNITYGHRVHSKGPIKINHPSDYVVKLETEGFVLADFNRRQTLIREKAMEVAAQFGGIPHIDAELLDEVTSLVEWPVPVIGTFESRFLDLPSEVLITTMQANQKYFPVRDSGGQLLPHFITFSNVQSTCLDTVRQGNERVVRPRLSDAEFFWKQDRAHTLEDLSQRLANVTFQNKLGSLLEKSRRVARLAGGLAKNLGVDPDLAERAGLLGKSDLLTNMVGEFPELQGTMGRYYALSDGENEQVALALEEQYLPKVSGGSLPTSGLGSVLALAEKIDTLTGIFSIGIIPTGDKDPYALRRAALGVIRIAIENQIEFDIKGVLAASLEAYDHPYDANKTLDQVQTFISDRLRGYYLDQGYRYDDFDSVLGVEPSSLLDFDRRIRAVRNFRSLESSTSLTAANKRIRNLLKKAESIVLPEVDPLRFSQEEERRLHEALVSMAAATANALAERDYLFALQELSSLRGVVDDFFDQVMVFVDDPDIQLNRLALLSKTEGLFLLIADLSRLQD
jgi:glycyl-tRNA synthetase beta chain